MIFGRGDVVSINGERRRVWRYDARRHVLEIEPRRWSSAVHAMPIAVVDLRDGALR